ncbi:MAG: (2Fe-2S)-binding protein, partial [Bacilli bacterium]|nr:(2Fe-2S)-binding protein [Bacilli bacterium]
FSGTRACTYEEDFVIQQGKWTKNIIHAAGIQSPGLSCSPAIGKEVAKLAAVLLKDTRFNSNFNPKREAPIDFASLPLEMKDNLIKRNPNYGEVICRCEKITKQEIIDAIRRPLPVNSTDAIKRRTRAGMGRCQGGFCGPHVLKILAEEKGVDYASIAKKGNARVLDRKSK